MTTHKDNEAATTPKDLLDEMKALVSEAQHMMSESVPEHSAEALQRLHDRFTAAREQFVGFCGEARRKVVAGARSTDTAIRTHPYESIAIAAGVGLLAGLLLSRRGK